MKIHLSSWGTWTRARRFRVLSALLATAVVASACIVIVFFLPDIRLATLLMRLPENVVAARIDQETGRRAAGDHLFLSLVGLSDAGREFAGEVQAVFWVALPERPMPVPVALSSSSKTKGEDMRWYGYLLQGDADAVRSLRESRLSAPLLRHRHLFAFLLQRREHVMLVRHAFLAKRSLELASVEDPSLWSVLSWSESGRHVAFRLFHPARVDRRVSLRPQLPASLPPPLVAIDSVPLGHLFPDVLPNVLHEFRRLSGVEAELRELQLLLAQESVSLTMLGDDTDRVVPVLVATIPSSRSEHIQAVLTRLLQRRMQQVFAVSETVRDVRGRTVRHFALPSAVPLIDERHPDGSRSWSAPCALSTTPSACEKSEEHGSDKAAATSSTLTGLAARLSDRFLVISTTRHAVDMMFAALHEPPTGSPQRGMVIAVDMERLQQLPLFQTVVTSLSDVSREILATVRAGSAVLSLRPRGFFLRGNLELRSLVP